MRARRFYPKILVAQKRKRILVPCVLWQTCAPSLSAIDKDFNMGDSADKERSNYKILNIPISDGYRKIGFLGRTEMARRKKL